MRSNHLDESVNVPDRRDVLRDERLELGLQVDRLRRVAHDVREQLANLRRHVQGVKL